MVCVYRRPCLGAVRKQPEARLEGLKFARRGGESVIRRMRAIPKWWIAGLTCGLTAWLLMQSPARGLGLRVGTVAPGEIRIAWNRGSAPALRASGAVLEIDDGGTVFRRALGGDSLRSSSLTYVQRSGKVRVRLRVLENGGAVVQQEVGFTGAPAPVEVAATPIVPRVAQSAPVTQTAEVKEPAVVKRMPEPPAASAADRTTVIEEAPPAPVPVPQPVREFHAQLLPHQTAVQSQTLLSAPPPVNAQMPQFAQPQMPPVSLPKPPPSYAGPRAGRLIWTGLLGRRGVVEIEGGRPSVGELSGALPGVPVSLRVQPAEFGAGGLVVFTGDSSANGRVEAASERNGWNATHFQLDPERAGEIVVLEAPNPSNDFRRVALRSDARRCTVIVIDWSVR